MVPSRPAPEQGHPLHRPGARPAQPHPQPTRRSCGNQQGGLSLAGSRQAASSREGQRAPQPQRHRQPLVRPCWTCGAREPGSSTGRSPRCSTPPTSGSPVELLQVRNPPVVADDLPGSPLPDGGWATEDEFDAAEKLRDERENVPRPRGGGNAPSGVVRKPFTGLPGWIDGNWQYTLHSRREGALRAASAAQQRSRRNASLSMVDGGRSLAAGAEGRTRQGPSSASSTP